MRNIFIVGASGLIGGALYNNLSDDDYNVIGTYSKNKEDNLVHFDMLKPDYKIFDSLKSEDVVFIMTAYSNPNWISENKAKAKLLNLDKTCELIDVLSKRNPKIVFMSSVEIFDGTKGSYIENDEPNPLNYYGELKLEVEKYLIKNYSNHCIVRTGWNVGLNKKSRCVIQLTYETLLSPFAKMATDNFFSLAFVEDTAVGLTKLINNSSIKKIHLCSDQILKRTDLANMIIEYSNKSESMKYINCFFEDIKYKEPRGRVNNLINSLSKKILKIDYLETNEIIRSKVKYLDQILSNAEQS